MSSRWPGMMRRKTAAEYVDMSEAAFEREIAEVAAITGQTFQIVEYYAARVDTKQLGSAAMLKFEKGAISPLDMRTQQAHVVRTQGADAMENSTAIKNADYAREAIAFMASNPNKGGRKAIACAAVKFGNYTEDGKALWAEYIAAGCPRAK